MNDSITKEVTYHVEGSGPDTELVITAHGIHFVQEIDPRTGIPGDVPHPWTAERRHLLGRAQAIELARRLSEAAMRQDLHS